MSVVDIAKPRRRDRRGGRQEGRQEEADPSSWWSLLLAAGAGYWFFLKPAGGAEKAPEPGVVVKLDAIQINLADGHYLKVGIALQASKDAAEDSTAARRWTRRSTCSAASACEDLARSGLPRQAEEEARARASTRRTTAR